MARTKQPATKREASSEFFNKTTANWEAINGHHTISNGHAKKFTAAAAALERPEAGVVQLVVAVAGIYASL